MTNTNSDLNQSSSLTNKIIAASISSTFAELVTIPVCTLKTNYQTNIVNNKSILSYANDLYRSKGIYGFYNATAYASLSQVTSLTIKYTTYEYLKTFTSEPTFMSNLAISVASSIIASPFHHPFDFMKIRTQMITNNNTYPNVYPSGYSSVVPSGYSVYQGYTKTLTRNILTSILFPLNDWYKKIYSKMDYQINENICNMLLAPISTSITSTFILYPYEFIRNRHIANCQWYYGLNPLNYYRGVKLALFRNSLHFTLFMNGCFLIKKYLAL